MLFRKCLCFIAMLLTAIFPMLFYPIIGCYHQTKEPKSGHEEDSDPSESNSIHMTDTEEVTLEIPNEEIERNTMLTNVVILGRGPFANSEIVPTALKNRFNIYKSNFKLH